MVVLVFLHLRSLLAQPVLWGGGRLSHLLDLRHHRFVPAQRVHDEPERRGPVGDGLGVDGRRGGEGGVGEVLGGLLEVLEARVWRGEGVGGLRGLLRGRLGKDAEDAGDVCVHGGRAGVLYRGLYMGGVWGTGIISGGIISGGGGD